MIKKFFWIGTLKLAIKRGESRSNSVTDLHIEQNISPKMEQFKGSMNNSNDQEPKDTKMMTDEMKQWS
jgi:hypothetical protein